MAFDRVSLTRRQSKRVSRIFPYQVREMCLGHAVGGGREGAIAGATCWRSDGLLMEAWAAFPASG